jgi:hypothetical protein
VLVKTKGKIYFRMGLIYYGYLIALVSRLVLDINREFNKDGKNAIAIIRSFYFLNIIATKVQWICVYYFVVIVRDIKLRLAVEDPREFGRKIKRQRVFNNSILAIFIVCYVGYRLTITQQQNMRKILRKERNIKGSSDYSD